MQLNQGRLPNKYMLRDLELKSEEKLQNQRKSDNWKRRQELKLKDDTKVLNVSRPLRNKAPKEPKIRRRRPPTIRKKQVMSPTRIKLENRHVWSERLLGVLA